MFTSSSLTCLLTLLSHNCSSLTLPTRLTPKEQHTVMVKVLTLKPGGLDHVLVVRPEGLLITLCPGESRDPSQLLPSRPDFMLEDHLLGP